jgi:hypothetical protein
MMPKLLREHAKDGQAKRFLPHFPPANKLLEVSYGGKEIGSCGGEKSRGEISRKRKSLGSS